MFKTSPFSCSEPPTIWFGGCLTSKNNILENVIKRVFLDSSAEEKAFNIFRPFYFPCSRVSSGWQSAIIKRKAAPLPVVPLMKTVGCDMLGSHHVGGWMLIEVACQQRGLGSCQQCPHSRLMLGCHPGSRGGEYVRDTLLGMGKLDTGILDFVWENWNSVLATVHILIWCSLSMQPSIYLTSDWSLFGHILFLCWVWY